LAADLVLVVPDIHERIRRVERILARYLPQVREVVFLGDYFDSFTRSEASTEATIGFVKSALQDPRFTLLLGNHDLHYLWPHMKCSGWSPNTHLRTKLDFTTSERNALRDLPARTAVERHGWLLSHAGVHPHFLAAGPWSLDWLRREAVAARREADHRVGHWLLGVSRTRGGIRPLGGPFWMDWSEFSDDLRLPPQLVGHTETGWRGVRTKGRSHCIDTCLRHVALLAPDGALQVERTEDV
jgi:hypothetical protein